MPESKCEPLLLDQYFSVLHLSLAWWLAAAFPDIHKDQMPQLTEGMQATSFEEGILTANITYLSSF